MAVQLSGDAPIVRVPGGAYGVAQYSIAKIALLWIAVTLPMGVMRFVVHPWLAGRVELHPGITANSMGEKT